LVTFDGNGAVLNIPATPNLNSAADFNPRIVAAGQTFDWTRARLWGHPTANAINSIIWPNNPERAGYVFSGWFTRESGVYAHMESYHTQITEDITLYARWIPVAEYDGRTVVFNPQNGTPISEFVQVDTLAGGYMDDTFLGAAPCTTCLCGRHV